MYTIWILSQNAVKPLALTNICFNIVLIRQKQLFCDNIKDYKNKIIIFK